MQPGHSINEAFERLLTVLKDMDQHIEFQYDEHLGYITSCPTNLGTGMRASYLVHLPGLSNDRAELDRIAEEFNLEIRGSNGEGTGSPDNVFDISNRIRLGCKMNVLINNLLRGVKELMKQETDRNGTTRCGPHLERYEDIEVWLKWPESGAEAAPVEPSLLQKHLNYDLFKRYESKKDKQGVSFKHLIFSGCKHPDSEIGVYAGSQDSYHTFKDLFDPII